MSKLSQLRKEVTLTVDGEPFTVTIRKIGTADVLKHLSKVPTIYSDLIPSDAREAIKEAATKETEAEKAAQGLAVAYAIIVAGCIEPRFCFEPTADCLSPMELEDASAEDTEKRLKPVFDLVEAILTLSNLEGLFRRPKKAKQRVSKKA